MNDDLISRSALLKEFEKIENKCSPSWSLIFAGMKQIVQNAPDVDAVQVVRCKDCGYYKGGCCDLHSVYADGYTSGYNCMPDDDDFCSLGERSTK